MAVIGYFALKAAPFSKEIADQDLWVPSSRRVILDELVGACQYFVSPLGFQVMGAVGK